MLKFKYIAIYTLVVIYFVNAMPKEELMKKYTVYGEYNPKMILTSPIDQMSCICLPYYKFEDKGYWVKNESNHCSFMQICCCDPPSDEID